MTELDTIVQKLRQLPPELLAEIDDFIDFVRRKRGTASVLLGDTWPPGFFEATMGALADDPMFVRHDQGTHEQREPLP